MLIPMSLMQVVWKERNTRTFNGIENDFNNIKDRWMHNFGFLFLGHDSMDFEDVRMVLDQLTEM